MSGLFGTLNVGKRGLFAQQKAIDVTSHNIANANTEGYSRQRAIMVTTRPYAMPSINNAIGPGQMGTGVEVQTIQRVRDEFLDFQVRDETSVLGTYKARDRFLSEIESILNEPSDEGISKLIGDFFDSWEELTKQSETSNARTVVAQKSLALANELNHTYNQLQKIRTNTQLVLKDSVFEINNLLTQIDDLNQQIMTVKISHQEPNDLMDRRDLLLDQLSEKFGIKIDKGSFYSHNLTPENVEVFTTIDATGKRTVDEKALLVRQEPRDKVSRFSYINSVNYLDDKNNNVKDPSKAKSIKLTYFKNGNINEEGKEITIKLDDKLNYEQKKEIFRHIDETRVIWADKDGTAYSEGKSITVTSTAKADIDNLNKELGLFIPDKGELTGYMSVQKDIDNYEDQVNKLAKSIALSVNTIHSGKIEADDGTTKDYVPFFVNKDAAEYTIVDGKHVIYDGSKGDKVKLDEVLKAEEEITAGNITINKQILDNIMEIKTRAHDDEFNFAKDNDKDGESENSRALAIARLRTTLLSIQSINPDKLTRKSFIENITGDGSGKGALYLDTDLDVNTIKGNLSGMKIDNYFKDIVDTLAVQEQEAIRIVKGQEVLLKDFTQRKESISGVSMDEEMANLIQFQHAYSSNAKIISTVDELLDVVVNGLKR